MADHPLYDSWVRIEDQDGPFSTVHLNDDYIVVAENLKRHRNGAIIGNLMLNNGAVVYQDLVAINMESKRQKWAEAAANAAGDGGPTVEQLVETILQELLPSAIERLTEADSEKAEATQADQMVKLVTGDIARDAEEAGAELFHDPSGETFATIPVGSHRETWPLRSRGFRSWARRLYYDHFQRAPRSQAVNDAIETLDGTALYDGVEAAVHVRLAEENGVIFLDLGDPEWQCAMIGPSGWQVIRQAPVRFRRPAGMQALPVPAPGGSIGDLRPFVNVASDQDWQLLVAWLVAALRPTGPYPVAVLSGEQGSAKSTTARLMRALIDPNVAAIRSMPRTNQDLVIAARNGWTVALDNVSSIPIWLSDGLCRLSTGGGFSARQLYTDAEETLIDVQRPVILNGITEVATRSDLIDRSLIVTLPRIPDARRRDETDLWAEFAAVRAGILGALLDVVSAGLRALPTTHLDEKPRMADFALWLAAAEPALGWPPGSFQAAYHQNRRDANTLALEASPMAAAVRGLVTEQTPEWRGTASTLLDELDGRVGDKVHKQKGWPKAANSLSRMLTRLAPNLRAEGIDIRFTQEGHERRRIIELQWVGTASSASSADPHNARSDGDFTADDSADDRAAADDRADDVSSARCAQESRSNRGFLTGADDADDVSQPPSSSDAPNPDDVDGVAGLAWDVWEEDDLL